MTTETEPKIRTWICVHTAPQAEFAVRDLLIAAGYPALLPTGTVEVRHARRKHLVQRPVFPRYIFTGVPEDASWYPIRAMTGVQGVLSVAGTPRPVPDSLVRMLKAAVEHDAFTAAKDPGFKTGDAVRIRVGQTSLVAFVEKVNSTLPNQRIDVVFDLWGRKQRTTISVDRVERIGQKLALAGAR